MSKQSCSKRKFWGLSHERQKSLVKNCLRIDAIMSAEIEVSIKCRIGLGKNFNYEFFSEFINEILKKWYKNYLCTC